MNVTVKNLPDHVADSLRESATSHGRSLNTHVIAILTEAAAAESRRRDMRAAMSELDAFVSSLPPIPGGADLLHEDRRERDSRLG